MEMAFMAQVFSWVGMSAQVGFREAASAEAGAISFRSLSPGRGNESRKKQKTY